MTRYLTTLVVLATCVALAMPAWAQSSSCPDECRNGGFEVDGGSWLGDAWDGASPGDATPDQWPDQWSRSSTAIAWVANPDDANDQVIQGVDGESIWQVVDEKRALWQWDSATSTWTWSPNTCWIDDGIAKTIGTWFQARFDFIGQAVIATPYYWIGTGTPVDLYDGTGALFSGWQQLGSGGPVILPGTTGLPDWYQGSHSDIDIQGIQPQFVAWEYEFLIPDGAVYLDDIVLRGECTPPTGDDSPEAATWLLLACTGVFGTWARRRRNT